MSKDLKSTYNRIAEDWFKDQQAVILAAREEFVYGITFQTLLSVERIYIV